MKTTIDGVVVDAHANVEAAHEITRGEGVTIAIIDDGVDIDHPEFGGTGKVVAPRDATLDIDDPRPKTTSAFPRQPRHRVRRRRLRRRRDGASGVAPDARLDADPARLRPRSQDEADAFKWAADHGADVISCSWGPADGRWFDPNDPRHGQLRPDPGQHAARDRLRVTAGTRRQGLRRAVRRRQRQRVRRQRRLRELPEGDRRRRLQRPRASAASTATSARRCGARSRATTSVTPPFNHADPLTPGIWTTDRVGAVGYNDGQTSRAATPTGDYTNDFGGTSSACPGAAGVAALILSVNPDLQVERGEGHHAGARATGSTRRAAPTTQPGTARNTASAASTRARRSSSRSRSRRAPSRCSRTFDAPIPTSRP